MKHSSRSLRENGTPRACRPGGRCRDCYPGAPTLGRATAAHLGFGCPMILLLPKFHLRASDPQLGRVVSGPRSQHHDGRPGRWFRDWLPDDMPHFIPFHFITIGLYCIWDTMLTVVYMLYLYIDNKHILNFEFVVKNRDCMYWSSHKSK